MNDLQSLREKRARTILLLKCIDAAILELEGAPTLRSASPAPEGGAASMRDVPSKPRKPRYWAYSSDFGPWHLTQFEDTGPPTDPPTLRSGAPEDPDAVPVYVESEDGAPSVRVDSEEGREYGGA